MAADDDDPQVLGRQRDHGKLAAALRRAKDIIDQTGDRMAALRESFDLHVQGLGADKALLLEVRELEPLSLEVLLSHGLSPEQAQALRECKSSPGVSPTVIGEAIKTRATVFIPSAADSPIAGKTVSLSGTNSVLCAPLVDSYASRIVAVCYCQTRDLINPFDAVDQNLLDSWAWAIGQVFGLWLLNQRQQEELETERERGKRDQRRLKAPLIIGDSQATKDLRQLLGDMLIPIAGFPRPKPLLITGESGTGKDVVARYIHFMSVRQNENYVPYNCAGLSGDTAKSLLFGHKRGAFTGADRDSLGLFREADKGVLFLDEVGELPLESQALLLRTIETGTVQPLGEFRPIPIDVFVIFGTNRDLRAEVAAGRFRQDLFMRISAVPCHLLPLRHPDRLADIYQLIVHFLRRFEGEIGKVTRLKDEVVEALLSYAWPGNVRELENVCSALVMYSKGVPVALEQLAKVAPQVLDKKAAHNLGVFMTHDLKGRPEDAVFVDRTLPLQFAARDFKQQYAQTRLKQFGGEHETARALQLAAMSLSITTQTMRLLVNYKPEEDKERQKWLARLKQEPAGDDAGGLVGDDNGDGD